MAIPWPIHVESALFQSLGIITLCVLAITHGFPWIHKRRLYAAIPAIGPTLPILSFHFALKSAANAHALVEEGLRKHRVFRIPQLDRWHIMTSGRRYVEEMRKADDILSSDLATEAMMFVSFLFGPTIHTNTYTNDIVKTRLARNLPAVFGDLRNEIILAFEDKFPLTEEWSSIPAYDAIAKVVVRATNRIIVGVPLCRNEDYLSLNIGFTMHVIKTIGRLILIPGFLRKFAARWLSTVPIAVNQGLKHLGPIIEERQKMLDEYGADYSDKPNDFLMWAIEGAKGEEKTPLRLTNRILGLNFAAIHTSSMTFTHAVFELAARPQFIDPLREEVETIVERYGWSKMALLHMVKLDSFFKESQRINGVGCITMSRVALKEFSFSDGTRIPEGALISTVFATPHMDSEVYPDPKSFQPFRFAHIRESEGKETTNQFAATNPDYIAFGYGKHACPGRFFAANEVKAMMAHFILNYDFKLEQGVKPPDQWFGTSCLPNTQAPILFRRRQRAEV